MKMPLPKRLTIGTVAPLIDAAITESDNHDVELDFSSVRWAEPSGAVYLAFWLRQFASSGKPIVARKPSGWISDVQSYLSHIGFWRYIDDGREMVIADARSEGRYLPFTPIVFPGIGNVMDSARVHKDIERQSRDLARVISRIEDNADGLNRLLAYSFRETIRNVLEHAGTDTCIVSGQNWDNDTSEIVIADTGMGISESFRESINLTDEQNALELALQPGVSSKVSHDYDDEWDNSGFGLFMLSEIGRNLGRFLLISDGNFIHQMRNYRSSGRVAHPPGTLVAMRFGKLSSSDFRELLEKIQHEGESVANRQGGKSTSVD